MTPDLLPGRLHGVVGSAPVGSASGCGIDVAGASASDGGVTGDLQS